MWAGRSQGFPQNLEGTARGTNSEAAKEYSQSPVSSYPLSYAEDETKEKEFGPYPGGLQDSVRSR